MIKAENNRYYMTAGETCYIIKQADVGLSRLFFGKRVEAEDDLSALGMEKYAVAEMPEISATVNGTPRVAALKVTGSEVIAEKPTDGAVPIGGKTLKIYMSDAKLKLNITAVYTPYSRGGMLRSFVVENTGKERVTLDLSLVLYACPADCVIVTAEDETTDPEQKPHDFVAVARDRTEARGEVYGFLNVHGDNDICLRKDKSETRLCRNERGIVLNKGETYRSPDVLCVFSDGGLGGMSRIFHDILRDNHATGMRAERAPVVLFAPLPTAANISDSVREASELGCDVFAVDGGDISQDELTALSKACKAVGIKLGLKITGKTKHKCVLLSELIELVQTFDIEYIIMDGAIGGARAVLGALSERFPELFVELDGNGQKAERDQTLYTPPGAMRNIVGISGEGSLKSRFDRATFGRLGYAFDPLEAGSDIKRAVRAQILSYQDDAALVLGGDLYRVRSSNGDKCMIAVSKDKSGAYAVCEIKGPSASVRLGGLDEHNIYHVRELGKSFSGAALCACGVPLPLSNEQTTVTLHIRQVADYE